MTIFTTIERDWILPPRPSHPIRQIGIETAREFGISEDDLFGKRRTMEVAHARQVAYFIASKVTNASTTKIGRAFGGRDHSTICEGIRAVERRMDDRLRQIIQRIEIKVRTEHFARDEVDA